MKMGELGCGFPLFFDLIKYLIGLTALCTLVGVFMMVENYSAGKEDEWDSNNDGDIFLSGSLGAYGKDDHPSLAQPWLNVVLSWIMYGVYLYLWFKHKRLLKKIDDDTVTPSDFTLYLSDLPDPYDE
jgi:hypothetical protein